MARFINYLQTFICLLLGSTLLSCKSDAPKSKGKIKQENEIRVGAKDILGKPSYLAISYGGYRETSRDKQPTMLELKEDLRILYAMGIRILRTYNVQLPHAGNVLKAIRQLKKEDTSFKMYVMLGAWIDCKNAWTSHPNHDMESEANETEIKRAVVLAQKYPDIVKVLAVGNEAMVKWATSYYVQPSVILKWVNYLQDLKKSKKLSEGLWITSSDNFASWGGGEAAYHIEDLNKLIKAVDYISMHTYPMHDTHYNPKFWGMLPSEKSLSKTEQINTTMLRARNYAIAQYNSVENYMKSLGINKPIHIGETGWASFSNGLYGANGSQATDEYKQALYYKHIREWTNENGISCFYFEAFNEQWKDGQNPLGSENHFGLFTLGGKAKFALWDAFDKQVFKQLRRNGNPILKTYNGNQDSLMRDVLVPELIKHESIKEQ